MDYLAETQKVVLFGAGGAGIRELHRLGEEKVFAFCDNYKAGQMVEGKRVIDISTLKEIGRNERCRVVICVIAPHIACEIAEQLEENDIKYELCEECKARCEWDVMHIVDDEVIFLSDTFCSQNRKGKWHLL